MNSLSYQLERVSERIDTSARAVDDSARLATLHRLSAKVWLDREYVADLRESMAADLLARNLPVPSPLPDPNLAGRERDAVERVHASEAEVIMWNIAFRQATEDGTLPSRVMTESAVSRVEPRIILPDTYALARELTPSALQATLPASSSEESA